MKGIRTEIENILRVKMYAPRGFCLPTLCSNILNHPAHSGIRRIKMEEDRIYYIIEFEDIALNQQKSVRKFCRDVMRKDMVSIAEYHRQVKAFEDYLKRVRVNNKRIREGQYGV